MEAIDRASYATGTDIVMYSFDSLDYLSAAFHAAEIKINLMIISIVSIVWAVAFCI